jgi:hypothetical protein
MTRTEDHERVIDEGLMPRYRPRIEALLRKVGEACVGSGLQVERVEDGIVKVWDMCGDDFKWAIGVWRPDGDMSDFDQVIDVSVEIAEELSYGDESHEGYGVNFSLDVVECGGRILGGLTPYNYTDECWVDARDDDKVAERWAILEAADVSEVSSLILKDEES